MLYENMKICGYSAGYISCFLDMNPTPPVSFNVTYVCPEGMVFDHDWLATPFIMMTCQVNTHFIKKTTPFIMLTCRVTTPFIIVTYQKTTHFNHEYMSQVASPFIIMTC